ncbi:MAG: family 78 glycoside hydrolase catalytic domain [Candidatus Moranbacteria bacterium]|nr:family 78 glycoside hydrolase catalytic domain [Candidatus Moranbacteria bacterium]
MALCHSLRCERSVTPLGVDEPNPLLEWHIESEQAGFLQTAYRIQAALSKEALEQERDLAWDTGEVESWHTFDIPYEGLPIASAQRYFWRVASRNQDGIWTPWSETSWWETGLLRTEDWHAKFIEPEKEDGVGAERPAPYFRAVFDIDQPIKSARAYVSCHGIYELSLNGAPVGNAVFAPGYTSYPDRLQCQTYDVTEFVRSGGNAVGMIVGDGWYRGRLGITSQRDTYGTVLGALLHLDIFHTDGTHTIVATGEDWKYAFGPIRNSDLKDGETYDARLEFDGWDVFGFDDSDWKPAQVAEHRLGTLVASSAPPVRRKERFRPIDITKCSQDTFLLDFGQNIAGRVRFRITGPRGTHVRIRHGETLDRNGRLSLKHLQPTAPGLPKLRQEDLYILKGEDSEEYEPRFTYHGFRYAEVSGWPSDILGADSFEAIAIRTDFERTGYFRCSDPDLNRLYRNILWSMRGNSVDIPTDCPTRERSGWTADAHLFAATATYAYDTRTFYEKWLSDLYSDQHPDGLVPDTIPDPGGARANAVSRITDGSSGWGDAAVIIPWILYSQTGDRRILERQYRSMKNWVDYGKKRLSRTGWSHRMNPVERLNASRMHREPYILDSGYHWGEWLRPGERKSVPLTMGKNILLDDRSESVAATAYLAHSADLLSRIANILDVPDDARRYSELFDRIRKAYSEEFIRNGRMNPDDQSVYVRTLAFSLAPDALRPMLAKRLNELVEHGGYHPDTGFLSTAYLLEALNDAGFADTAYRLLKTDTYPSWLHQIRNGATTIWESWDGIDSKGQAHFSHNHTALGSIGRWFFESIAGIKVDATKDDPTVFRIAPALGGGLTHAAATYHSPFGIVRTRWDLMEDRSARLLVSIPPNTRAEISFPTQDRDTITESGFPVHGRKDILPIRREETRSDYLVVSGTYVFEWPHERK